MSLRPTLSTLLVADYYEAIAFYVDKVGFVRREDSDQGGGKRWVAVFEDLYGNRWNLIQPLR